MEKTDYNRVGTMYKNESNYYRVVSSNGEDVLLAQCNDLGWTFSEISSGACNDTIVPLTNDFEICNNINNALVHKNNDTSLDEVVSEFGFSKYCEETDEEKNRVDVYFNKTGTEQLLVKYINGAMFFNRLRPF